MTVEKAGYIQTGGFAVGCPCVGGWAVSSFKFVCPTHCLGAHAVEFPCIICHFKLVKKQIFINFMYFSKSNLSRTDGVNFFSIPSGNFLSQDGRTGLGDGGKNYGRVLSSGREKMEYLR